jgi:hypothetical protein
MGEGRHLWAKMEDRDERSVPLLRKLLIWWLAVPVIAICSLLGTATELLGLLGDSAWNSFTQGRVAARAAVIAAARHPLIHTLARKLEKVIFATVAAASYFLGAVVGSIEGLTEVLCDILCSVEQALLKRRVRPLTQSVTPWYRDGVHSNMFVPQVASGNYDAVTVGIRAGPE